MNPLEQLKDIHLPEQVGQWPPAYGWWLLAAMIIALMVLTVYLLVRRYRRRLAIRQALKEVQALSSEQNWPQQLNQILKRLCLSYFPTEHSASLHQQQWLKFLTTRLPVKKQQVFMQDYSKLLDCIYRPGSADLSLADNQQLCRNWIKSALPPKKGGNNV